MSDRRCLARPPSLTSGREHRHDEVWPELSRQRRDNLCASEKRRRERHHSPDVSTATALGRPWAFSDRDAELGHALHFDDLADLDQVPWQVMNVPYWTSVREERQAEFLVHDFFPWTAVTAIGVKSATTEARVRQILTAAAHRPALFVRPNWYY